MNRSVVGIACFIAPIAFAQGRVAAQIDWAQAQRAQQAARAQDAQSFDTLRSSVSDSSQLDSIALPVLVPGTGPVRAAPRIRHQRTSYSAIFALANAKLTIAGAGTAMPIAASSPLTKGLRGVKPTAYEFEKTEDGADLSFTRFGAAYVLRISCVRADDDRCTEPKFLQSVAATLIPIGGRKQ